MNGKEKVLSVRGEWIVIAGIRWRYSVRECFEDVRREIPRAERALRTIRQGTDYVWAPSWLELESSLSWKAVPGRWPI